MNDFAVIASHDLRAPLRGISNHARFLLEDHGGGLPADARRRLDRLQELCEKAEAAIATLLAHARIGGGARTERDATDTIVRDVVAGLSEMIAETGAEVVIETDLPEIEAAPSEVATAFRNLVVNAMTYNDAPGKRVSIGFLPVATVKGQRMPDAFYVVDNGIGTEIYYPVPMHLQDCFRPLGHRVGTFPESEKAASETLALPVYPELGERQLHYVCETLSSFPG